MSIDYQQVKKLGRIYFLTFSVGGVRKQWYGTKEELEDLHEKIGKTLALNVNNVNGERIMRDRFL